MAVDDARRRLQAAEDDLVRALMLGGPLPGGHDAAALARARAILVHKKRWVESRRARRRSLWARIRHALGLR